MTAPRIPAWRRPIDAVAGSRLGSALLARFAPRGDVTLLRLTGGRFALTFGLPTLLLTTTGRKSGEPRSTPLLYLEHADAIAVIGTKFGSPQHPAWALNLLADPRATVLLDGEEWCARARLAAGGERSALWEQARSIYGGFDKYQARVGEREIPIFVLERAPDESR
jgi:deazaflavin-dependent oxidoreductase (nitroreductase family)